MPAKKAMKAIKAMKAMPEKKTKGRQPTLVETAETAMKAMKTLKDMKNYALAAMQELADSKDKKITELFEKILEYEKQKVNYEFQIKLLADHKKWMQDVITMQCNELQELTKKVHRSVYGVYVFAVPGIRDNVDITYGLCRVKSHCRP